MTKDAERRFKEAAKELHDAGWSRTQIHAVLSDALPNSNWNEKQRMTSIREIGVMIDVLSGLKTEDIKTKHNLKSLGRKSALYQGARKTIRTLNLSIKMDERPILDKSNYSWWIGRANEALNTLKAQPMNENACI